jgi:hypothetical protein
MTANETQNKAQAEKCEQWKKYKSAMENSHPITNIRHYNMQAKTPFKIDERQ